MNELKQVAIDCPYCGETIDILIDCSIPYQSYIEDCQVCCRPINLNVVVDEEAEPVVTATHEDQ